MDPAQRQGEGVPMTQYEVLQQEFNKMGVTYKSNEVLHKMAEIKCYPYPLLLEMVKLFHMNQFEIIFFSHILNDEQCRYQDDPQIFQNEIALPEMPKLYNKITNNGEKLVRAQPIGASKILLDEPNYSGQSDEAEDMDLDGNNMNLSMVGMIKNPKNEYWSLSEMKKLYKYLLVIGYSIKYYLNEITKAYEEYMKKRYPEFFSRIFNAWVDKYSNKVLRTNPRKINLFYMSLFQAEDNPSMDYAEADCQYRNYNQIVFQLLKATSEGDEYNQIEELKVKEYEADV